ncbi:MAG TPA: hypothetical protein VFF27_17910 [Bacteroidia bacterium]|jgi:hypothetical protein|nr:hypothetical protein [Bacteroidia bacterium]
MKQSFIFLCALAFVNISFKEQPQTKELFKDENKLASCYQQIPLTYKNKDEKAVATKANELRGQELVLLHYDKKSKEVTYKRYYLISELAKTSNDVFNFLIEKDNYLANKRVAVFLKYTEKYDRFYVSSCFDKVLLENPELASLLKEQKSPTN